VQIKEKDKNISSAHCQLLKVNGTLEAVNQQALPNVGIL
jgi:hypothetical protein